MSEAEQSGGRGAGPLLLGVRHHGPGRRGRCGRPWRRPVRESS
ncbi:hypothetical protein ACR6C2_28410 [Streptomyces sp. INA 01156]